MDTVIPPNRTEINGFDLSNYVRDPNSYNPIVYIHKRHLKETKNIKTQHIPEKYDQFQQYDCDKVHKYYKIDITDKSNEDPMLKHTIKFARELIPLAIPAKTSQDPVYYTLKTAKKIKRKHPTYTHTSEKDGTFEKEKCKHINEKRKQFKSENLSTTETTNPSSQNNTIDDINENRSLSYSLSEISDRKNVKCEKYLKEKKNGVQKFIASESFDAFAAECIDTTSKAAIKIQLLNDTEKHNLVENIRIPIIKSIKESIFEACSYKDVLTQLCAVEQSVHNNSKILENIWDKLSTIEKKLEIYIKERIVTTAVQSNHIKTSKLEELGEDLIVKEDLSSEEELMHINLHKKRHNGTTVAPIHIRNDINNEIDNMGRGDKVSEQYNASTSQIGIRTEPLHRMPARFCWTDAKIN